MLKFLFATCFCLIHACGLATPSASDSMHVTLLGGNAQRYLTLEHGLSSPPSHYSYSRSLRVCTRESSTGKVLKEHSIESVHFSKHPDDPDFTPSYHKNPPVDLARIIRSIKGFDYAWPVSPDQTWRGSLLATPDGIVGIERDGVITMLMPLEDILRWVPWYLYEWNSSVESRRNTNILGSEEPCYSCGWWGDPQQEYQDVATTKTSTSPSRLKSGCPRSRAFCGHVQIVQAYTCGGHLYVLIKEGSAYDEEGGANSALVRLPNLAQNE